MNPEEQWFSSCIHGEIENVKDLLNDFPDIINKSDNFGDTGFLLACMFGHLSIVQFLLNDSRLTEEIINKSSNDRNTAFSSACMNSHLEVLKLLLNDSRLTKDTINKPNNHGNTVFAVACKNGLLEIVKLLLSEQNRFLIYSWKLEKSKTSLPEVKQQIQNYELNVFPVMLFSVIRITENDNKIRSKDADIQRFLNICKTLPIELKMLISFLAYKNTKEKFIKNETLLKLCINYFLNGE